MTSSHSVRFFTMMATISVVVVFFIMMSQIEYSNATLIHLTRDHRFCLHEHLSENTPFKVSVTTAFSIADSIHFTVMDPFGQTLKDERLESLRKNVYHLKARSDVTGEYELCFTYNSQFAEFTYVDVKVEVDVHHHTLGEHESVEKIERLNNLLQDVKQQIQLVSDEQNYFRVRETRFRDTTDSTYERTFWLGFVKFILLVVVTVWQLYNLRGFFKTKKLI
ncbi:hypothetical protein C9374_005948 [Naegleria lovaniensis]|uniref:GOLD domain-containing protein n=1 Tax=Naegleria lovaniensis TaxID=51637 RepID=A0AA88GM87_NAELO|nr:uncharacterized protein C9374_005948 [Naegleria lovaniensis]KAG2381564.1 hypothetical protein C9374_005948 [Naegleria lovaniensis]